MHQAIKFADGWRTEPEHSVTILPCPKRVRTFFGGEAIADSLRVLTLLEQGQLPIYFFPLADVRQDLLTETDVRAANGASDARRHWTVSAGGERADAAVWAFADPPAHLSALGDHVAFTWSAMDRWLEEDEEVFVHARDPLKRIDITASDRPVEIVLGDEVVAHSTGALFLFETGLPTRYYLPADDVRMELLTPTETRTQCPYKGEATYWTATIGGQAYPDVVWSYPEPIDESARIRDHLCFFNEVVDAVRVDGEEMPRPRTKWSRD